MNVWLPTSPCTPEACAGHEGRTASVPHALLRLTAAAALILLGILGAPPARLLPAGPRHAVVRAWSAALVRAFGIRITVHGSPGPRGARLLVANHISWLDVPLVAAVLPSRMLAKSDIRAWPLLGRLAAQAGTLFIERDRIRALPATVSTLTGALLAGDRVTVFPEGSTWCGRDRGAFRRAAFQAALDARAPVQPVRITYARADGGPAGAPAFVGDDPLTASLWRTARARGIRAEVTLLPRIPPGRHTDRRDLAAAAERAVAARTSGRTALPDQPTGPPATARDSAKRPAASVHHWVSSSPAAASSLRTPS
ncbi:lysophospholipid acyltransferase family protein [Streptomyces sp. NRRL F-2664]|uniref:lysophospholipid acyltransferase family protein n=1 Tax=Streptomyces sp. NRRL F-2664 TaxID=1463842 RepID=UPI0004C783A2|nr:lysophospholipid acyltransferase family protein [Streptomyces sp. NRRL F-2664]